MLAVIVQTLKRKKISLFVYCLASILFLWMFVAMYPSIFEQAEQFEEVFKAYPDEFLKIFSIESLSFDTVEKFLAVEHYSIMWPLMALFFMVSLAGFFIVAEIEKGTLSLILARPISRIKIFLSRYLSGLIILAIFCLFSVFAVIPLAELHNVDYEISKHFSILILCYLFGWAIFSLSMMFSAVFSEKSKLYMVMGGTLFVMYALNVVANLRESWEVLRYFSFFHYFDYNAALIDNSISNPTLFVFVATIVISFICGLLIFNRRDIAI